MRLSQGQLTLLETCPRQFQHVYLEQMAAPLAPEQQISLSGGQRFHLLMQQAELGLPVAALAQTDAMLEQWFTAFRGAAAQIMGSAPAIARQSEQLRTLEFADHLLTVVYDLVILTPDQAQILDWKTAAPPQQSQYIHRSWQTRLYQFVLAETIAYAAHQITLTYWFFAADERTMPPNFGPQSLKFSYDRAQHQKTHHDLTQLLNQLTAWLADYATGKFLPQVLESAGHCGTCSFAVRCQRGQAQPSAEQPWPAFGDIPELAWVAETV